MTTRYKVYVFSTVPAVPADENVLATLMADAAFGVDVDWEIEVGAEILSGELGTFEWTLPEDVAALEGDVPLRVVSMDATGKLIEVEVA